MKRIDSFRAGFRLFRLRRRARKAGRAASARLHECSDILSGEQRRAMENLAAEAVRLSRLDDAGAIAARLEKFPGELDACTPGSMKSGIRNLLDLIAVVAMVACGVRGIFLQPFQIPTSSMQPTLYGIHYVEKSAGPSERLPAWADWMLYSSRRARFTVPASGRVEGYAGAFFDSTVFRIGGRTVKVPGTPAKAADYADLRGDRYYTEGQVLCDGWLNSGDHLFVDRVGFHIFPPKRGDVIVFTTDGINMPDGTPLAEHGGSFYIKRLIGLPGDTLRFTEAGVEIRPEGEAEFRHITEFSPRFERLYSGLGGYQKHSVYLAGGQHGSNPSAPMEEYTVPEDCYYMLGDNVNFSSDSRIWGCVPRANIVGRAAVVFWPFSRRWGLIDNKPALEVPTGEPGLNTFPVMALQ